MSASPLAQRLGAEFIGAAFLLATVIGSGIMGERLAGGNEALALLGNTLPTGAILVVLITMLGPVSGAHFNPAVTGVFYLRGDIGGRDGALYVVAQIAGALVGVVAAHAMFELPLWQAGVKIRSGPGQWLAEGIATFGLLLTILATLKPGRPPCRCRSGFTSSPPTGLPPRRRSPTRRSPWRAPSRTPSPASACPTCLPSLRPSSSAPWPGCWWRVGCLRRGSAEHSTIGEAQPVEQQ